jgi:putative ABC transport system permease protein
VRAVDARIAVYGPVSLEQRLGNFSTQRRSLTVLLALFGAVALLLSAVGIYGVIQQSVAGRAREMAIRLAIGGNQGRIFRMVLREGLALSLVGLIGGLGIAIAAARLGSSLLYGISALDWMTFIGVPAVLLLVSIAASIMPARRATSYAPTLALRES